MIVHIVCIWYSSKGTILMNIVRYGYVRQLELAAVGTRPSVNNALGTTHPIYTPTIYSTWIMWLVGLNLALVKLE